MKEVNAESCSTTEQLQQNKKRKSSGKRNKDDSNINAIDEGNKVSSTSRQRHNGNTKCFNCGVTETPMWRKNPANETLCNKCGLYLARHGITRPLTLTRSGCRRERKVKKGTTSTSTAAEEENETTTEGKRKKKNEVKNNNKKVKTSNDNFEQPPIPVTYPLPSKPQVINNSNNIQQTHVIPTRSREPQQVVNNLHVPLNGSNNINFKQVYCNNQFNQINNNNFLMYNSNNNINNQSSMMINNNNSNQAKIFANNQVLSILNELQNTSNLPNYSSTQSNSRAIDDFNMIYQQLTAPIDINACSGINNNNNTPLRLKFNEEEFLEEVNQFINSQTNYIPQQNMGTYSNNNNNNFNNQCNLLNSLCNATNIVNNNHNNNNNIWSQQKQQQQQIQMWLGQTNIPTTNNTPITTHQTNNNNNINLNELTKLNQTNLNCNIKRTNSFPQLFFDDLTPNQLDCNNDVFNSTTNEDELTLLKLVQQQLNKQKEIIDTTKDNIQNNLNQKIIPQQQYETEQYVNQPLLLDNFNILKTQKEENSFEDWFDLSAFEYRM
ncbi:hypothetical protein ABK040_007477 [Willaertia magna]